jgi:predicted nuclease with TOPRIM domain
MFGIKNLFKREEKASLTNLQTLSQIQEQYNNIHIPKNQEQPKETQENKKTEIEILIAKIDALKFQYEALSEKISNMEKMLKEIYEIAKSSS